MIHRIVLICRPAILSLRERAASVDWAPTLITPMTELLLHGGGPTQICKGWWRKKGRGTEIHRKVKLVVERDARAIAQIRGKP